jgi:hypothetical protein
VKRMVPAVGKDWNDRLLAEQQPDRVVSEQGDDLRSVGDHRQAFKALWKWYRMATEKGHSEAYLKRITEVARDVVDGKGLSEKAVAAMEKDCCSDSHRGASTPSVNSAKSELLQVPLSASLGEL